MTESRTRGRLEIRPRENPSAGFFYDESHALLIGNVNYEDPAWVDLPAIPGELNSLAETLRAQGFRIFGNQVHLDLDEDGMRELIESFIETHGLAKDDNRLVIVYSGHGETLNGRDGYLVTIDAPDPDKDSVGFRRRAIPIRQFRGWALEAQAKHILFAFDSCFGGTVFSTRSRSKAAAERMTQLTGKPIRAFMSAGGAGEKVPARSVFTPYLSRGIAGEGDLNRDGFVTGSELFVYVREKVGDATANSTKNTVRFGPLPDPEFDQGDMVFVVPIVTPEVPVPTPVVLPKPTPVKTYGSLVVKSPRVGEVRLDRQGPFEITAGSGLEWKRLLSGRHQVVVTSGGSKFEETVTVEEGEKTEVTAWFQASSEATRAGEERSDNGIGFKLVYIPAGNFTIGSPASEEDRGSDENQVEVRISHGFWLGKYEVTQGEWESVMGSNPSEFKGARLPVEQVSWEEAVEFCRKLTEQERRAGRLRSNEAYRLPTEAQWEYACRAGTGTAFAFGNSLSSRDANFDGDYPYGGASKGPDLGKTTKVGTYRANGWGLYDMHGNVYEWCHDWYGERLTGGTDPTGATSGKYRVIRGGCGRYFAQICRSANRLRDSPSNRFYYLGFRVARVPFH